MIGKLLGGAYYDPSLIPDLVWKNAHSEMTYQYPLTHLAFVLPYAINRGWLYGFSHDAHKVQWINSTESMNGLIDDHIEEFEEALLHEILFEREKQVYFFESLGLMDKIREALEEPDQYMCDRNVAHLVLVLSKIMKQNSNGGGLL